jgi:5'-3' exonuclease
MEVHLVDGTYELFRAHFGAPKADAPDGQAIGAVRGLVRSLAYLLREATHVAVAFDHVIESFRNDLFAGYKTGAGIEEELASQFQPAEDAVAAMGIVVWSMVEFEADDALATGAARYVDEVDRVVLASPDKDLTQCVRGERVVLWDRMRKKVLDEAGVEAKFGVKPASIPSYLALVGDSADGIPGLSGWGAKSAAKVLAHYGDLDAIPDDGASWAVKVRGRDKLARTLAESRELARLYRTLATLREDVPLEESLADLAWRGPTEGFGTLCEGWGFTPPTLPTR